MGKYTVNLSDKAIKDLREIHKSGDKKSIRKLERIFEELTETPYLGIGEPKMLKYQYYGFWSRKVNQKDRLIYKVHEDIVTVFVVSAKGHYDDK